MINNLLFALAKEGNQATKEGSDEEGERNDAEVVDGVEDAGGVVIVFFPSFGTASNTDTFVDLERRLAPEAVSGILVTAEVAGRVRAANASQVVLVVRHRGSVRGTFSIALIRVEEPPEVSSPDDFFSSIAG